MGLCSVCIFSYALYNVCDRRLLIFSLKWNLFSCIKMVVDERMLLLLYLNGGGRRWNRAQSPKALAVKGARTHLAHMPWLISRHRAKRPGRRHLGLNLNFFIKSSCDFFSEKKLLSQRLLFFISCDFLLNIFLYGLQMPLRFYFYNFSSTNWFSHRWFVFSKIYNSTQLI